MNKKNKKGELFCLIDNLIVAHEPSDYIELRSFLYDSILRLDYGTIDRYNLVASLAGKVVKELDTAILNKIENRDHGLYTIRDANCVKSMVAQLVDLSTLPDLLSGLI